MTRRPSWRGPRMLPSRPTGRPGPARSGRPRRRPAERPASAPARSWSRCPRRRPHSCPEPRGEHLGAARRPLGSEPARLRAASPRPLGPRGGHRQAGRGGPAQRVRARARRRPQGLVALDPRRRGRAVDAGLPGRRAAVRHQHGGAGTRALARVRRPQRERPPRLPPLRAEGPRDRSPRRR